MVRTDLKKAIIDWLFEHENSWQRRIVCYDTFKTYIYDSLGNYLIGGKDVYDFIAMADDLIFNTDNITIKKIH